MADSEKRRHEAWRLKWAPLATIAVLVAYGAQPILPFLHPQTVFATCLLTGITIVTVWEREVREKRTKTSATILVASILLTFLLIMTCNSDMQRNLQEIAKPCAAMRARLLVKPNQDDAATYDSLHCPAPEDWPWKK